MLEIDYKAVEMIVLGLIVIKGFDVIKVFLENYFK